MRTLQNHSEPFYNKSRTLQKPSRDPSVLSHHTQHVEDWISLTDPGLVSDSAGSVGETGPEPDVSRDFRIIGFSLKSEWF